MKFDEDKITKLSSEFFGALRRLKELTQMPEKDFLSDPHRIASAKYHFIVAIEAAIDMGNHIISRNKLRAPEDYADTFRILAEAGAFAQDFLERLIEMAKFRNRLVHIYWEVDSMTLRKILQEDLGDLERLIEDFTKFLRESKGRV